MGVTSLTLVSDAFRLARVIGDDENPDNTQLRTGITVLSDLLSHWQTDVEMEWLNTSGWFKTRPGERLYILGPDGDFGERVVEIMSMSIEMYGVQPIPINLVDYASFLNKPPRSLGRPIDAYLEKSTDKSALYLWPTPTADSVIKFKFRREISDPEVLDLLEIPKEWVRSVKYNLARELCPRYGLPVPQEVREIALVSKSEQGSQGLQGGEFIVAPNMSY